MKKNLLAAIMLACSTAAFAQGGLQTLEAYSTNPIQNHRGFIVNDNEGNVILTIFDQTSPMQIINLGYVDINNYGDSRTKTIHYADVNFDGYPDILVGKDGPRCGITPVIYNPQTARYEVDADGVVIQSPLFDPANKVFYSLGSASAAQYYITRIFASGTRLIVDRTLRITSNLAEYNANTDPEFRAHQKYDLIDKDEKYINQGWNDLQSLPSEWRRLLRAAQLEDW